MKLQILLCEWIGRHALRYMFIQTLGNFSTRMQKQLTFFIWLAVSSPLIRTILLTKLSEFKSNVFCSIHNRSTGENK